MTEEQQKKEDNNEINRLQDSVLRRNWLQNFFSDKKLKARFGSAIVYEMVGEQQVLDGVYPLLKGGLKDVSGDYTVIDYKGKIKYLSTPDPKDFTPSYNKIKKVLHVVKMAEDDFRVMKRLDETYYKKVKNPLMEDVEVKNGEEVIGYQQVQKTDEEGNLLYEEGTINYVRPSAIIQEGREAIKEGNEYQKKMEQLRKKNESWFKKNAFTIMSYAVIMIMAISFMFVSNKLVDEFSEIRNDIYEDNKETRNYLSNGLISGIADKVAQKQVEDQNPPE